MDRPTPKTRVFPSARASPWADGQTAARASPSVVREVE